MHDLAPAQPEVKPTWHDSSSQPSVPTMASIACVVVRRLPSIASAKQARVSVLVVGRIDGQHDVVLAEREEPLARVHAQHQRRSREQRANVLEMRFHPHLFVVAAGRGSTDIRDEAVVT